MFDGKKYKACAYARLSQEDGDKSESDSIVSQKAMIREFVASHPEIEIVSEKVDDGYSGVNFERPGFQAMLEEIQAEKVNCVIVKDLSRFGRNYIETGNYLEKLFPVLGVRFIAINDYYDSIEKKNTDSLVLPFKNLINDAYCKDISVKIRTQLETKRKKGQYVGPNGVYGYMKDPEDHNHLVPDPYAAEIVRCIFRWNLQGMSIGRIAEKLNAEGVLCPMEYKISNGVSVPTAFRSGKKALWSYISVRRILENEVYIGHMIQGKTASPNHKIKKRFPVKKEEWVRVEGTHEPIVEEFVFRNVQMQLKKDTRSSPNRKYLYPLAGYVVCGDCGQSMTRKKVVNHGRTYVYYVCSTHNFGQGCTSHVLHESELKEAVLNAIRARVAAVADMSRFTRNIGELRMKESDTRRYDKMVAEHQEEIERCQKLRRQLYESLQEGAISKKDYETFRKNYDTQIENEEVTIGQLLQEKETMISGEVKDFSWMRSFRKYKNFTELDRMVIVEMIEKIVVRENKRVEIHFRYEDKYNELKRFGDMCRKEEDYGEAKQERIS